MLQSDNNINDITETFAKPESIDHNSQLASHFFCIKFIKFRIIYISKWLQYFLVRS